MLKVIAACGNGMGSSMMIKMKIEKVLNEMGIEHEVYHASVGQAKAEAKNYDLVIVSTMFAEEFEGLPNTKVVGLKNLLSEEEIKEKVSAVL